MRCTRESLFGAIAIASLMAACSPSFDATTSDDAGGAAVPGRACPTESSLTYESFGEPFFSSWCTGCHSSQLTGDARRKAPVGFDYDTLDGIRPWLPQIYAYAADDNTTMPVAGGPTAAERHNLGDWLACGAPGQDKGFNVPPSDASAPAQPTGACAAPHQPLQPAALPRCSPQTRACMLACKDQNACPGQCLSADPTPSDPSTGLTCAGCYYDQALACADPQCHDTIAQFLCCLSSKCPGGDSACTQSQCSAENTAFGLCLYYVTPHCLDEQQPLTSACFGDLGDAGMTDH